MTLFVWLKTRFVVWVWYHTPNCAEISRLTSRLLDEPLRLNLRLQMHLHHWICAWCRRYFEQLHFLHAAAPRLGVTSATLTTKGLPAHARQRIVQAIHATRRTQVEDFM